MAKVLVLYYSAYGHVETLANAVGGAMKQGGGREYGGNVYSGQYHQVGERNKPELLSTPSGQFLIPGDNGRVDPIRASAPSRGAMGTPQININVSGNANVESASAQQNDSGGFDVSVILKQVDQYIGSNVAGGQGATYAGLKSRFGLGDAV